MLSPQPNFSSDARPTWGRIVFGVFAGVTTGAFAFWLLIWPVTLLLDQLAGRSDWQGSLKASTGLPKVLLQSVFWGIPFALGQWLSALINASSRTIYFAATLQAIQMVLMFTGVEFAHLWALPFLIAIILTKLNWASSAAERGRKRNAKAAEARAET
jgi:hypothetical protein